MSDIDLRAMQRQRHLAEVAEVDDRPSAAPYVLVVIVTTGIMLANVAVLLFLTWFIWDQFVQQPCTGALICGQAGKWLTYSAAGLTILIGLFGMTRPWAGGAPRDWWKAFFPLVSVLGLILVSLLLQLGVLELSRMTEFDVSFWR